MNTNKYIGLTILVGISLLLLGTRCTTSGGANKDSATNLTIPFNKYFFNSSVNQPVIPTVTLPQDNIAPILYQSSPSVLNIRGSDGSLHALVSNSSWYIQDAQWLPDGKTVGLTYIDDRELHAYDNEKGPSVPISYKEGLVLVSALQPYTVSELIPVGKMRLGYLNWSPDSKYVSYVINDGAIIEVRDVKKNKVVLNLQSRQGVPGGARPLIWLDDTTFSYALDGNLYTGTLANPHQRLITRGVDNSECGGEGYYAIMAPDWSLDRKFVVYTTTSQLVVMDTTNGKKFTFLSSTDPNSCDTVVNGLRWSNKSTYFFSDHGILTSIELPQGTILKHKIVGVDSADFLIISPDGKYAFSNTDNVFYNIVIGERSCKNDTVVSDDSGWSEDQLSLFIANTSKDNESRIGIIDVTSCAVEFYLNGYSATFVPSVK